MNDQQPKLKHQLFMGLKGREVDIKIIASSEKMATFFYLTLERLLIEMQRSDLEMEWNRPPDGPHDA